MYNGVIIFWSTLPFLKLEVKGQGDLLSLRYVVESVDTKVKLI